MKIHTMLSNLSLRTKLILAFMVILFWLAAINCVQIYLFVGYIRQYNSIMETITLTNSINGTLKQQLNDEIREITYGKVPFENGTQYSHLKNMYQNLDKIQQDDRSGQFTEEIAEVRQTLNTTTEYIDKLGQQIHGKVGADERNITYEYITILSGLIDEKVQALLQTTLLSKEESKDTISVNLKRDITIYICSFIGVILTSLLFAWYISGSIVKPIRSLGQKTNEIAEGNLTIGKIDIPSKNEIGDLCLSYNRMFFNLKEVILSVRNTNDLVVLTSKDIHQSLLENRLAGEDIAEATQTISINLHKQDELIHKSVSTVENLFNKFNDVLIKSNKINLHSSKTQEMANEINNKFDSLIEDFNEINQSLQTVINDSEMFQRLSYTMKEHIKLTRLIARENSLLCTSLLSIPTESITIQKIESTLLKMKGLSEESINISVKTEDTFIPFLNRLTFIGTHLNQNLEKVYFGKSKSSNIQKEFQAIRMIRNHQQVEIDNIKKAIQESFEQMITVREMIVEIEQSSKISKEEVVGIAAMGEEQLTTLEEVSDASYKLVDRIQVMKENIRQFRI